MKTNPAAPATLVERALRDSRSSIQDILDAHLADRAAAGDKRVLRPSSVYVNDQRIYAPVDRPYAAGDVVAYGDAWGFFIVPQSTRSTTP